MISLAHLIGRRALDDDGSRLGKVSDIVVERECFRARGDRCARSGWRQGISDVKIAHLAY
ncbi:PRC-barrel domain-containing protein [Mycobacterium sp.]|uniref:PRC-barrel domain-containing protein n=1 Tax=Mycobacterium sp. TaxID=1785 RepID=UPI0039C949F6